MDLSWDIDVHNDGHEHTIQSCRSRDAILVAAIGAGLAAGAALGTVRRGSGVEVGFAWAEDAVYGSGIGGFQSGDAAGDVVLWLRERSVFKPEVGTSDARF